MYEATPSPCFVGRNSLQIIISLQIQYFSLSVVHFGEILRSHDSEYEDGWLLVVAQCILVDVW
jgi:hypothetical protein